MVPSAKEMATAIHVVTGKLISAEVLEQESYGTAQRLIAALKMKGDAKKWDFSVDRTVGFTFKSLPDDQRNVYNPVVSVDRVSVDETIQGVPPIRQLDVSLELRYPHTEERVFRWHFDQANTAKGKAQPGPLYHLQFGGHVHQDRRMDMPICIPRWSHPPMDLILLLEAVTANFFPDAWEELREDLQWCEQIRVAQRFCLKHYCEKLHHHLNASHSTVLSSLWADRWLATAG